MCACVQCVCVCVVCHVCVCMYVMNMCVSDINTQSSSFVFTPRRWPACSARPALSLLALPSPPECLLTPPGAVCQSRDIAHSPCPYCAASLSSTFTSNMILMLRYLSCRVCHVGFFGVPNVPISPCPLSLLCCVCEPTRFAVHLTIVLFLCFSPPLSIFLLFIYVFLSFFLSFCLPSFLPSLSQPRSITGNSPGGECLWSPALHGVQPARGSREQCR